MHPGDFSDASPGRLVHIVSMDGKPAYAYIPNPLPPSLELGEITSLIEAAAASMGALRFASKQLPNPSMILRPFARREAAASSRVEGTRVDFRQLALAESGDTALLNDTDVVEANNYLRSLIWGWEALHDYPVSISFISELHRQLLEGTRGSNMAPGELRQIQVYIGGAGERIEHARFVPPPAYEIRGLLDELCRYLQSDDGLARLARLAIFHYQFETIHPFHDGNGRLGRLMMPLMLVKWGLLDEPYLYLSEYIERNRRTYLDLLLRVSTGGEWIAWITFLLQGIHIQAEDAVSRTGLILAYREDLRARYMTGRSTSALALLDRLFERPTTTISQAAESAGLTYGPAKQLIERLEADGVLEEVSGRQRDRIYLARGIYNRIMGLDDEANGRR